MNPTCYLSAGLFSPRPYGGATSFETDSQCLPCQNAQGRAGFRNIAFTTGEQQLEDALWDVDGVGHFE